ncbi:TPA: HEPN domain-containing protein [Candidatus Woesearchaeota archaeon]|nr:HEPN domain-containing protein [Candidatus Woesearchaeota archaeon]HIH31553.1 HEPN domain-containing protein [Candidatus Woesearchaeota archaeon]HIH54289.1 HEPN domain-containing protein [Candidatus Woesearchaeota archaeon]HIJ02521.1 HEPN domain-containing protein [Candidatus Woesearchaeota archaeon]HIJ13433.1 HEPN domain-containing protein [Candidatus Woesearchaeota archaeon]
MDTQNKIKTCLKEGEMGEKHKGLRKIKPSRELITGHIKKAIHNFNAIELFSKFNYSDWSASAAFYCLYHGLLALIAKKGFESRNQSCTFALIEQMIEDKEISLSIDELKEIFDKDMTENLEQSNKILDIRENMQYSIKTSLEKQEFKFLKERTKYLFDKIRREVEKEPK